MKQVFLFFSMMFLLMTFSAHSAETLLKRGEVWWKEVTPQQLEELIKKGENVNAMDSEGNTVLMEAINYNKNPAIIETLIKHGANVNAKTTTYGSTPLNIAVYRSLSITEILIKNGADVNAVDSSGSSVLLDAITGVNVGFIKDPAIIKILIKNGANVNLAKDGLTPLDVAIAGIISNDDFHSTNEDILLSVIENLIEYGADVNAGTDQPLVEIARHKGKNTLSILKLLIKHGADVNIKNLFGQTALMTAFANQSDPDIIEILFKHGADLNAKDKNGKTVLDYANYNPNKSIINTYWRLYDSISSH